MSKKSLRLSFFIGLLFLMSFKIPPPPSIPHTWGQATSYPNGQSVQVAVDFASTTSTTVTHVRIFNTSCQQFMIVSTSGFWVVAGTAYKTTSFVVNYKDGLGNSKNVQLTGIYQASIAPCDQD